MSTPVLAIALILVLAGCEPLGPIPGGALEGAVAPPPETWEASNAVDVIALETSPDDPYAVNIWAVAVEPHLYVGASNPESTWAVNMLADPRVRVRIDGPIHELRATVIDDDATEDAVLRAFARKYELDPDETAFEGAVLFQLEPR